MKKLTTEEFILRLKNVHGDKYDCSKVSYVNSKTKVTLICPLHGEFEAKPNHLLGGHGCPHCANRYVTTEQFIENARQVHGDKYDYSKVEYTNKSTKVCIICKEHGEFWQMPSSHLQGCGCPKCKGGVKMSITEFIERANKIHNGFYDYSKVEYINAKTKVCIICPVHGEFWITPELHLRKRGCRKCNGLGKVKPCNYWNNKENCFNEAKKYHGKYDFQKHAEGAYNAAIRNGWLDEIASEFYDGVIHYMKENEPINTIYVYEFENKKCYVGRTNNLKRRDRQHRNGIKHSNGEYTYDNVYKEALNNNTDIPNPKILEEHLNAKESQDRENYWLERYKELGYTPLNVAPTGIGKSSLGARLKWSYEACKKEAMKYTKKHELKINCQPAYSSSVKNGWIDEFYPINAKRNDGYWNVKEHVLSAANECCGTRDMIHKFGGAYNAAKKNGWLKELIFNK